jgi:hypothetical protein
MESTKQSNPTISEINKIKEIWKKEQNEIKNKIIKDDLISDESVIH